MKLHHRSQSGTMSFRLFIIRRIGVEQGLVCNRCRIKHLSFYNGVAQIVLAIPCHCLELLRRRCCFKRSRYLGSHISPTSKILILYLAYPSRQLHRSCKVFRLNFPNSSLPVRKRQHRDVDNAFPPSMVSQFVSTSSGSITSESTNIR